MGPAAMVSACLKCIAAGRPVSKVNRHGFYFRTGDSRHIQRYWCKACGVSHSDATSSKWFRHKKRRFHEALREHFASLGSVRRGARKFKVNRKTIARKLVILGHEAEALLLRQNKVELPARVIEFDDLETFEHSKCKPLSVTLAVQSRTRRILGLEVSAMPAKGLLVEKAKKYGPREDRRAEGRERLFTAIKPFVHPEAEIKSDANPHYTADVKRHFPQAHHVTFKSRKGTNTGGGELKEGGFDPLFSLNHTCASFRMNVTRLLRKTWYTTKRADRLRANLLLYAVYHNTYLEQ
jgi:transposase-like protein